jgi:succinate dehydrogenase/fumarate reductase cytochrome b subunit
MGATGTEGLTLRTESLGGLHWVGILAAVVSAAIHLLLGVRMFPSGMGISFILAGLGFLGAVVLVLVDYRRRTVYAVGIPFVLVQIVLWFVINFVNGSKSFPADIGTLGAIDKVAQVVLVGVLLALLRS